MFELHIKKNTNKISLRSKSHRSRRKDVASPIPVIDRFLTGILFCIPSCVYHRSSFIVISIMPEKQATQLQPLKGVTTDNDGFEFLPMLTYSFAPISNRGKAKRNIAFISL